MKLKSFGCSFVWGSEMADAQTQPSVHTWPALWASHLNLPYECFARPGCGNLEIAENILNQVTNAEPALFVINWTYIDRFDYYYDRWETIRPDATDSHAKFYYKHLHGQYKDKLTTLMQIRLCIDTLQQAGHAFVMTYMDDLIFETEWHCSPAILALQQSVRPHLKTFDGHNMLNYVQALNHPLTSRSHPLEAAHQDLFKHVLANFGVHKV